MDLLHKKFRQIYTLKHSVPLLPCLQNIEYLLQHILSLSLICLGEVLILILQLL